MEGKSMQVLLTFDGGEISALQEAYGMEISDKETLCQAVRAAVDAYAAGGPEGRPEAEWIEDRDVIGLMLCSRCGGAADTFDFENRALKYCPYCGARMAGR